MNPFTNVKNFVDGLINDAGDLAISIFALGFIVAAFVAWRGSEESVPRAQKAMVAIIVCIIVVVLAKIIVGYVKSGVA